MKILLSPAKSMKDCPDKNKGKLPQFNKDTQTILKTMQGLSAKEIGKLMKLSEQLSQLNYDRFQEFNIIEKRNAIFLFDGDVYKGFAVEELGASELDKAQDSLRILSGMYGLLKPMDLISPYRLEMGTRVAIGDKKNLYEFWKKSLTEYLASELEDGELIVNLASVEYSKAVDLKSFGDRVVSPVFKEKKGDGYKVVAIYAKRARGLMARFIVENGIEDVSGLKCFDYEGYSYSEELSSELEPVFVRG